jgi:hypothetical protein
MRRHVSEFPGSQEHSLHLLAVSDSLLSNGFAVDADANSGGNASE